MDEELDAFKALINLTEYAAACGYVLDRRVSSRNSAVMRHGDGDKIVIARNKNGHWIYFSVRDDNDNGTIVDFVQRREGCQLGRARQLLRPWTGQGRAPPRPQPDLFMSSLQPVTRDRARVVAEYERMSPIDCHPYLETERAMPAAILSSPRFAGKIRTDKYRNAVFGHYDQDGLCGYEMKNKGFTGFAKGGEKGLWFSAARKGDTSIVLAESAIDAISHAALFPDGQARYASIGGKMNPAQPQLVKAAILRMPDGARIIAATDNDPDGRALAAQIETIVRATGRAGLSCTAHHPEEEGADWNDCLRAGVKADRPALQPGP